MVRNAESDKVMEEYRKYRKVAETHSTAWGKSSKCSRRNRNEVKLRGKMQQNWQMTDTLLAALSSRLVPNRHKTDGEQRGEGTGRGRWKGERKIKVERFQKLKIGEWGYKIGGKNYSEQYGMESREQWGNERMKQIEVERGEAGRDNHERVKTRRKIIRTKRSEVRETEKHIF